MNFAQMLATPVTPLADVKPVDKNPVKKSTKVKVKRGRQPAHPKTLSKYKAGWEGDEWVTTSTIEKRLGCTGSNVHSTLRRWEKAGLVESRPITGKNGKHKRSMGIEWRWKQEEPCN